jgi:hypothetical protein
VARSLLRSILGTLCILFGIILGISRPLGIILGISGINISELSQRDPNHKKTMVIMNSFDHFCMCCNYGFGLFLGN